VLIDALILLPVSIFLLWLYLYSGGSDLSGPARLRDRAPALLAPIASVAVLAGLHMSLEVDGLSRNVVAVTSAYLTLLGVLGSGWLMRWLRSRR
jgi:hypothetical protein